MSLFHQDKSAAAKLSVSQLNARARQLLEQGMARLWVEGEVSNFNASAAGHWYFTLKDEGAQLPCVMFSGCNQRVLQLPADGDQLALYGQVSLYEGRGQYQLLVESLNRSGEGQLLLRLEALKKKLQAQGLFAAKNKRPLPAFPQRIGIITSAQGAALRDLLHVLKRRWPVAQVLLYPAQVQGAEAAASLRRALALAQYHGQPEVLLLARGGGNLEDLQAFNDETLARMVAASQIPVITGVGHATDTTLVDFVSDLRTPTPTAAAEAASPDAVSLQARLRQIETVLHARSLNHLRQAQQTLNTLSDRLALQEPYKRLLLSQERLDRLHQRLQARSPQRLIKAQQQHLAQLTQRLPCLAQKNIRRQEERLQQLAARLDSLSPLSVLNRGYALARNQQGQVLKAANQVQPGEAITVELAQGQLACRVEPHSP